MKGTIVLEMECGTTVLFAYYNVDTEPVRV